MGVERAIIVIIMSCIYIYIGPASLKVIMYDLDACAADALKGDTVVCSDYNVRIPLKHLIPDLLLTDLPTHFIIDNSQLEFNPKVSGCGIMCIG